MSRRFITSLLVPLLAACSTVVPVASPGEYISTEQPERVWVTRADGAVIVLDAPQLFGESLVGFVNGNYEEMPLGQVTQLQARRAAPGRTVLLIAGTVVVIGGVIHFLVGNAPPSQPLLPDEDT
jgi:hypothetical protein